jgi:hypothetical protein
MTPEEFKAEFNTQVEILRVVMNPAVGGEVTRFQQSGLYPNEFNIDTFTGAIDDEALAEDVRDNLRLAAGYEPC